MRLLPDAMPLSGRELRDSILSILARDWPLSAREVYSQVRKTHKLSVTYQGVHKSLRQMVSEGVLLAEDGKYLVNVKWARQMADFGNKIATTYASKAAKTYLEVGVGSSVERDAFQAGKEAATKALKQLKHEKPLQLVLVFSSSIYDVAYEKLLAGVRAVTKKAPLAGCSTFGEIANRPLAKSVAVMLFAADKENFSAQIICLPIKPEQYETGDFKKTAAELERQIKQGGRTPEFGILLTPGYMLFHNLETITPALMEQLIVKTKLPFPLVGGLAGDDWHLERTPLFCEGKAYEEHILLVAIRTKLKFGIAWKHGYSPVSSNKFKIRMDAEGFITEMAKVEKGKPGKWRPCTEVYMKETGISSKELKEITPFLKEVITQNKALPMKRVSNNLLSFPYDVKGTAIRFQKMVSDGDVIQVMRTTADQLESTSPAALQEAFDKAGIQAPAGALFFICAAFECILSNQHRNEIAAMRKGKYKSLPMAGFYSGGEIWSFHQPQASGTTLAVAFGNELR
ncbi:hypothetical protein DRN67_04390 [Candidatus Micrarchaeota archaeon]|nr:MAG: hypothetical protein DRN67_04390 [Candidatus Micrarchaeota archaeon]